MSEPKPKFRTPPQSVQLQPVLDAMLESMIVIDESGIIEQINRATIGMFGYSQEELIGKNIRILMSGPDEARHDKYLDRYRETGKKRIIGKGREVQATRKDGTTFPCNIDVGEVSVGRTKRFVGLIRDLTATRAAEEVALRQREEMVNVSRLSMMGEMAAAMAHELNQPLAAISNYAAASLRLLDMGEEGIEEARGALKEIVTQALRAGEVIQRTRSFTRQSEVSNVQTTLAKIAGEIRTLAEVDTKANNIRLDWNIPRDLPSVAVDPVQIQQVILNLIRNAVDAMHDTEPERRTIKVSARLTGPYEIRLEVIDSGTGVSEDAAKDVFNAFFTTKLGGMGMGLAICRTIVRNHGGELSFRNNDRSGGAQGATFFFTLPTKP
jgi:two-component system sensor kinase FixL